MSCLTSPVPFADPTWHRNIDSPYFNSSHRRLQREVREYVDKEVRPNCGEWEAQGYIPDNVLIRHAKLGYFAVSAFPIPENYVQGIRLPGDIKPKDWDAFHDYIIIDEMARCGHLGVVWGINGGSTVGSPALASYATPAQKEKYLGPLLRGDQIHCLAVTEPGAGSDVSGIETTATKTPDGRHYMVNGAKKWITQGQKAHYCLTAVRTGGPGAKGISMVMIPMTAKGVSKRKMHNSGVSSSGSTYIEFDDVMVPVEDLVGGEGKGFAIIMHSFNHERIWMGINSLRLARVALEDAYEHALRRETWGKKLIENQMIRTKFTDMAMLIEPCHALMENLVSRSAKVSSSDVEFGTWAALLKVQGGRVLEKVSRESQQVFGGLGYSRNGIGGRVEQISRDVRVIVVSGGSEEILMDAVIKLQMKLALSKSKI